MKIGIDYPSPIPKLFPKDLWKKIMGLAGNSDLMKRHNLHVLASPKHKENKGFNLDQSKHPKRPRIEAKNQREQWEKHTKLLHETTLIMSLKRGLRLDYNEGFRPKQPPSPSLLIWRLDLTLTLLNLELKA
ncbi:hypothetical protein U9M48_024022 [Paspalum notatum var. saurae]|uniref:Uncharacterized protein n=1 Tax=Paspalum notatum var. saurae TaxID=547442 RepID=A0AAQ3WVL3_PASNO